MELFDVLPLLVDSWREISAHALQTKVKPSLLYLEVHCTYHLLSNCSYNPIISWVTVVMGLTFRLYLQILSRS